MLKFWHIQAILLFLGERTLVHGGSSDKAQSQGVEHLDMQALSAYFEIQNISRLFSLPGAAPSHQVVQEGCALHALAELLHSAETDIWAPILTGEREGLCKSVIRTIIRWAKCWRAQTSTQYSVGCCG